MNKVFTSALIVSLAMVSPGLAQTEKKISQMHCEREAMALTLLRQKSVREDLKVDMETAKKIFEFTFKQYAKAMEVHQLPKEEQTAKWETMGKENEEFLHKTLTAEQHKRLRQIAMQTAGVLFVTAPKIAKELNLTEEQKTEAKKLQDETQDKVFALMSATAKEDRHEKLKAVRDASNEKLSKLLSDEQKKIWKEHVGEPFKGQLLFEEQEKGK